MNGEAKVDILERLNQIEERLAKLENRKRTKKRDRRLSKTWTALDPLANIIKTGITQDEGNTLTQPTLVVLMSQVDSIRQNSVFIKLKNGTNINVGNLLTIQPDMLKRHEDTWIIEIEPYKLIWNVNVARWVLYRSRSSKFSKSPEKISF